MTKNHLQRHRDVIHLKKEKGEKDNSECKEGEICTTKQTKIEIQSVIKTL